MKDFKEEMLFFKMKGNTSNGEGENSDEEKPNIKCMHKNVLLHPVLISVNMPIKGKNPFLAPGTEELKVQFYLVIG